MPDEAESDGLKVALQQLIDTIRAAREVYRRSAGPGELADLSAAVCRVRGYASVFNVRDDHGDIISPGAYTRSLAKRAGRLPMFWGHDRSEPIGRWERVIEDENGLYVEGVCEAGLGRLAMRAFMQLQSSCHGLSTGSDRFRSHWDASRHARVITELDLVEASVVWQPSNAYARGGFASYEAARSALSLCLPSAGK